MWDKKKQGFYSVFQDYDIRVPEYYNKKILKPYEGTRFVKNLEALRNQLKPINNEFWEGFLDTTTKCLLDPENQKNQLILNAYLAKLQIEMEEIGYIIHMRARKNSHMNLFFIGLGTTTILSSIATFIPSFTAGTMALALGPLGITALSAGLFMVGLVVTMVSAYHFFENKRLMRDAQFKEIQDYVKEVTSTYTVKEGDFNPLNIPSVTIDLASQIYDDLSEDDLAEPPVYVY